MSVTLGAQPFSSGAATYAFIIPSVTADGSLLTIGASVASSTRTYTPSGAAATMLAVTPDSGTSAVSGHGSYMWQGTVDIADTGATILFTQAGGNVKTLFLWALVDNPDPVAPRNRVVANSTTLATTTKLTPASTVTAFGSIEIQFVFDSRGATTPNTTNWTRPLSMSAEAEGFLTGSSQFTSGAVGYNVTTLNAGAAIGGDTWTADTSGAASAAIGSMWTIGILTTAGAPTLTYTRQRQEIFDCTASVGGSPTLTKIEGPSITITENPAAYFKVTMPEVLSSDLVLDVGLAGAETVREVISAEAYQALRLVYDGADWN